MYCLNALVAKNLLRRDGKFLNSILKCVIERNIWKQLFKITHNRKVVLTEVYTFIKKIKLGKQIKTPEFFFVYLILSLIQDPDLPIFGLHTCGQILGLFSFFSNSVLQPISLSIFNFFTKNNCDFFKWGFVVTSNQNHRIIPI